MAEESQEDLLRKSIDKALEWVERTENFAIREAPATVKEVVTWERVVWPIWLVFWGVLAWGGSSLFLFGYSHSAEIKRFDGEEYIFAMLIGGALSLGFSAAAFSCFVSWMRALFCPRLVILEKLKGFFD